MRARSRALVAVGIVAAVVLVAVALVRIQSERFAAALGDLVTGQFGEPRNIRIEAADIGGSLLRDVRITDLRIIYTGGERRVLLAAAEVYGKFDLLSFFRGTVKIDSIHVTSPRLVVPVGVGGRRVFPQGDPVPGGPGRDVSLRVLTADDISVVWEAAEPWLVKGKSLTAGYAKQGEVSTVRASGVGLEYGLSARVEQASVDLRAFPDRVEIGLARFRTPASAFSLAGLFGTGANDSVAAEAALDSLAVAEISALAGRLPGEQAGAVAGTIHVAGRYDDLRLTARLSGAMDAIRVDGLDLAGVLCSKDLVIERLACVLNGSPVEARGSLRFSDPPEYSAEAAFSSLDLARLAPGGPAPTDLSGRITVRGRGFARDGLEATVWSALEAGRYDDWPFDGAVGRVDLTGQGALLDSVVARVGGTEAVASGSIGWSGDTDLAFDLDCPDLKDLEGYHRLAGLEGELSGRARLTVKHDRVGFSSTSLGRGIDYGGAYLESLLVDVDLDQPGGRWSGRGDLLATSLNLRGFKAGTLVGKVGVEDSTVSVEELSVTRPDGDLLGASGRIVIRRRGFVARIEDLFVEVAEHVWRNRDPIRVKYGSDSLEVSGFVLASQMGTLSVSNSSFGRDRYAIEAEVIDLDLARVKQAIGKDIPTGTLSLDLKAAGVPEDPTLDLGFRIRDGEIRSVGFSSLGGSLRYGDKTLAIEDVLLSQNGGTVRVDGRLPIDLSPRRLGEISRAGRPEEILQDLGDISVRASGMDISIFRPLAPPLARVAGVAELDLRIGGSKHNPRLTSTGTLRQAALGRTALGDVTWDVVLADSLLRVANLAIADGGRGVAVTGDLPLALSVAPFSTSLPRRPMDLSVRADKGDLALLCEIVPRLKVCSGAYAADLRIGGMVGDPTFQGKVSLAGAGLRFEGVAQGIEDLHLEAEAAGKRFVVTGASAEGGALRASGWVDLEGVTLSGYQVAATMKRLPVTEFEDFYAVLSGDVTVTGEQVEYVGLVPRIEGAVTVDEGEYYYSADKVGGGGSSMGPEAAPTWLMNVGVEIPNDFWVRGNDIEAELEGSLNVKRGSEGLLVLGMLRTLRGTFSIYNNEFKITRGEFRFTDVKSVGNAYIDLEATSRVLEERVDISAKGSMDNLDVTATSESGWSETQIFEALTLRRGSQAEGPGGGKLFTDEFLRSWGVALVNRFGNDVARELRLDQFGVEVGDVGEGDLLSATRVTFGKYVSDKVYLQYTQSLGSIYGGSGKVSQRGLTYPERQFLVEYRLSDRFSMEGEAGTLGGLGYFDVDLKFTLGY